jgi:hypothetical protein
LSTCGAAKDKEALIDAPGSAENPLAGVLWDYWTADRPHHERLILAAAVVSTALWQQGMRATLVGGGAIELHAPGIYQTGDIDFIVEGKTRVEFGSVLESLGLKPQNIRAWARGNLWVEVPALGMDDPADLVHVGSYDLRVIRKEWILGERIAGFRHWKFWGHGLQAIGMIRAFGDETDERELAQSLRREGSEHAYGLLRSLADSGREITEDELRDLWYANYR